MITVEMIKEVVCGNYKVAYAGAEYGSFELLKENIADMQKVVVEKIECNNGMMVVSVQDNPVKANDLNEPWVKDYIKENGCESSFF